MNHDERDTPNPTEAEIVSLLGTYADALERINTFPVSDRQTNRRITGEVPATAMDQKEKQRWMTTCQVTTR